MPAKQTRSVEYYRCWAGGSGDQGEWDTDFIDIPRDTPEDKLEEAVREAAEKVQWRGDPPVLVGLYSANDDDIEEAEESEEESV